MEHKNQLHTSALRIPFAVFSPGGGGHDTPAAVHGGSAAAAALRRVVVHAEVVSELMGQSNRSAERVIGVILEDRESEKPSVKHNKNKCLVNSNKQSISI